jgi:hypothetical protein
MTRFRAAMTNGRHVLNGVDHRSAWMRRLRDLIEEHEVDLGGADYISASERRLVRRAAMMTIQLEMMDLRFAQRDADTEQLEIYQRMTNSLRRCLEALGLRRRPRDVTPSVSEYVESLGPAE